MALLAPAATADALPSESPDPGYVTNGPVHAIAHAAGSTYIGGDFTRVGLRTGSATLLSSTGPPQPFPEVAGGDVRAAISDGQGGWYIGGTFTAVNRVPRIGLARILAGGAVDPGFAPVVTDAQDNPAAVNALALAPPASAGGAPVLYVGGLFARIGSGRPEVHHNLAALDARDGAAIGTFAPRTGCLVEHRPSCEPIVNALAVAHFPVDGTTELQPVVFVGGDFTTLGYTEDLANVYGMGAVWGVGARTSDGLPRTGDLAKFGTAAWAPKLSAESTTNSTGVPPVRVHALAVGPVVGKPVPPAAPQFESAAVYIAGASRETNETVSLVRTPFVKAFQFRVKRSDRTLDRGFDSATRQFSSWNSQVGRCTSQGCRCSATDCGVRALALGGGWLYFGGDFDKVGAVGGSPPVSLGKIEAIADPDPTAGVNSVAKSGQALGVGTQLEPVSALAWDPAAPTRLLVGGGFDGGVRAVQTSDGAPETGWAPPGPDRAVEVLVSDPASDSTLAGGQFRAAQSTPRARLAAFGESGELLGWAPSVAADPGERVHALAASEDRVYAGGQFEHGGRTNLVGLDTSAGAVDESFRADVRRSGATPDVLSLALAGSGLYVGGAFDEVGGAPRRNLAAVDAGHGAVTAWNPDVTGTHANVRAILPACGAVFVGGSFDRAGGADRANAAQLTTATGQATAWTPEPNATVHALAAAGPHIYAGGDFSTIGGQSRQRVGAVDGAGRATPFNMGIDALTVGPSVRALAATDSALYVGGTFVNARDQGRLNLAAVNLATGEPLPWDPRPSARVEALVPGSDNVYAGGGFGSVGDAAQRGLATFGGAGGPAATATCLATENLAENVDSSADETDLSPAGPTASPETVSAPQRAPVLRDASVSRVLRPRAPLEIRFRLSTAGAVRVRFDRLRSTRCRRRGVWRRCQRYARFAQTTVRARAGRNRVRFRGRRVQGRRVVRGRYRVTLVPLAPNSRRTGRATTLVFRVAPS